MKKLTIEYATLTGKCQTFVADYIPDLKEAIIAGEATKAMTLVVRMETSMKEQLLKIKEAKNESIPTT